MQNSVSKRISFRSFLLLLLLVLMGTSMVSAQTENPPPAEVLPTSYRLDGITHIYQGWNNCGPATIMMGLSYFGVVGDQNTAAQWLKPNTEDKNVSPWQMTEYVNTISGTGVQAALRYGGTQDLLKRLLANNFPVVIESGYDPVSAGQGWMGHYLLVSGYDDAASTFLTQDSYDGPNLPYTYDHIQEYWQHFNYVYIVLYTPDREAELSVLLGTDWDSNQNAYNALIRATDEARADQQNPFAWFNVGTGYTLLGDFPRAAAAYDTARSLQLPWRMTWYQFGIFEAYLQTGRFEDVLALARANLNDGGGQYVEETFYYGGLARQGLGETQRALDNLNGAISFNRNFTPALEARDQILGTSG